MAANPERRTIRGKDDDRDGFDNKRRQNATKRGFRGLLQGKRDGKSPEVRDAAEIV